MDDYKGKVRVVWRDLPLPFHPNALPAAIAARAAGEQGKFWEMHDKLFANQAHAGPRRRSRSTPRSSASTWASSRRRSTRRRARRQIEADAAAGGEDRRARHAGVLHQRQVPLGRAAVRGVQGQDRRGAEGRRRDDRQGDAEGQGLRRPDEGREDRGRRRRRPPPPGGAEKTPEQDTTVYKVDAGRRAGEGARRTRRCRWWSSPTSSARSASGSSRRCRRWRRSTAARCAWSGRTIRCRSTTTPSRRPRRRWRRRAQGKFWEMHDKLFANNTALDRPNLEKYAAGPRPQHGQVQGRPRRAEVQGRRSRPRPRKARRWA